LIVEDDPNLRLLWRAVFGDRGCSVTEANTVAKASSALRSKDFDLIFLDLYLGRDSGLALVDLAADICPETRVVIVTGAAQDRLPPVGRNIQSVLRKPVDIEDLLTIANALMTPPPGGQVGGDMSRST
jgi:CheY-like chemotaxis protein